MPFVDPNLYVGKEFSDDEIIRALIKANFIPNESILSKSSDGKYIMNDETRRALRLFKVYHGDCADCPKFFSDKAIAYYLYCDPEIF